MVRLLNEGNWDQNADTKLNVGDIWDIQFIDREDIDPPHIEDVIIQSQKFVKSIGNLTNHLLNCGIKIYNGSPTKIFEGRLGWTGNGGGYIGNRENLPVNSVGFWIADKDLVLESDGKHYSYAASNFYTKAKHFPYVGFEPAIQLIPSGTLLRVSLARWWKPDDVEMDERCYLQLSGWYNLPL